MDETPTPEELLLAWSNASLAAELARRLAGVGDTAQAATGHDADAAPEVASLVESTAEDATETAAIAQGTGERMQRGAEGKVSGEQEAAAVPAAAGEETLARGPNHEEEPEVRQSGDGQP